MILWIFVWMIATCHTIQAGDLLYIPPGWWHSVLNLSITVAFTRSLKTKCVVSQFPSTIWFDCFWASYIVWVFETEGWTSFFWLLWNQNNKAMWPMVLALHQTFAPRWSLWVKMLLPKPFSASPGKNIARKKVRAKEDCRQCIKHSGNLMLLCCFDLFSPVLLHQHS